MVRVSGISFKSASPAYIQLGYYNKNKNNTKVKTTVINPIKIPETRSSNASFGASIIKFIKKIANS